MKIIKKYSIALVVAGICVVGIAISNTVFGAGSPSVTLRIEDESATVFSGSVEIGDCSVQDTDGATHELSGVALCALDAASSQAGFDYEVQDFGFGLFVNGINGQSTPSDFSKSWSLWANESSASVGADALVLSDGDVLLFAFTSYPGVPLRVQVPSDIEAGVETILSVEKLVSEFDADWNLQESWQPAEGATLYVGGATQTADSSGQVSVTLDAGSTQVYATNSGAIKSAIYTVEIASAVPTATPTPTVSASPTPTASPSVSPTPTPTPSASPTPTTAVVVSTSDRRDSAKRALQYLRRQQDSNGSIDGSITSAWSMIAFGSNLERATNITAGGSSLFDSVLGTSLSSATDIERTILATRASGVDPRNFGGKNLITLLKSQFKDNQIGETSLTNDDIFGVLALLAGQESVSSNEIQATVQTILDAQSSSGAWDNIDVTSAGIQALKAYEKAGGSKDVSTALANARAYLKRSQDAKGGFDNNSATTAWSIQAIIALGEDPNSWTTSDGRTPWDALMKYQNTSGAFGWKTDQDTSAFLTAYAVPALLGVHWPVTSLSIETVSATSAITVSYSPSPTPQVAGVSSVNSASNTSATSSPSSSVSNSKVVAGGNKEANNTTQETSELAQEGQPQDVFVPAKGTLPVSGADRRFAFSLFGFVNMAIGLVVNRLLGKLGLG